MFRSFEANSGTIERKESEDLAKSSTFVGDQSYLGRAPNVQKSGRYDSRTGSWAQKRHVRYW
ncbi:MAG: hypothetical protein VST67_13810, partial [Nitrospirota bacterium]|nr:hypothetical protein [Nitrospirota bacterium]